MVILNTRDILRPSRKCFINRLTFAQYFEIAGEIIDCFPLVLITGTDIERVQATQYIQLGYGQTGQSIQPDGIVENDGVKPAASPFSSGGCPEFGTFGLNGIANRIEKF